MASWGRPAGDESDSEDEFCMDYTNSNNTYEKNSNCDWKKNLPSEKVKQSVIETPTRSLSALKMAEELRTAIIKGNFALAKDIVESGYPVDDVLKNGWTPLLYSCTCSQFDIVNYLVDKGANVNFDYNSYTPLMALCASCSTDRQELMSCCEKLVQHGANVNAEEKHFMTPLMFAIKNGQDELVQFLISQGANVNACDNRGWSPLAWAASVGSGSIIKILLEHKADANVRTQNNESITDIAKIHGFQKIAESFQGTDADNVTSIVEQLPSQDKKIVPNSEAKKSNQNIRRYGELDLFLRGLNLPHLIPVFESQQISFQALLTLSEEELEKAGVQTLGERIFLLDSLKTTHKRKWLETSLPNINHKDHISSLDANAMLENIAKHLEYIWSTIRYMHKKIELNPTDLEVGKDIVGVVNAHEHTKLALSNLSRLEEELKTLALKLEKETKKVEHKSADLVNNSFRKKHPIMSRSFMFTCGLLIVFACWNKFKN